MPPPQPSPDPQKRARDRFRQLGDSTGGEVVTRLEKNAKRVIKDLVDGLQRDIVSVRSDSKSQQGQDSSRSITPDQRHDNDDLTPLVGRLRSHFENAAREWKDLVQEFEEVRSEIVGRTPESVFGSLFEKTENKSEAGSQEDPGQEPSAQETDSSEHIVPDTPPPPHASASVDADGSHDNGAGDGEDETPDDESVQTEDSTHPETESHILEEKLDDLLLLVRDHVSKRDAGSQQKSIPEEWTHRIAKEVAHRLRESMNLSQPTTSPGNDGEAEKTVPTAQKRISIDDVAAMIDEITGNNG